MEKVLGYNENLGSDSDDLNRGPSKKYSPSILVNMSHQLQESQADIGSLKKTMNQKKIDSQLK